MMRRSRPLMALVLTAALLSGCGRSEPRPLTVVGWGGSSQEGHRQAYWIDFSETENVPLQEDVWHGGIGVLRTRVQGGGTSWDVVQVETEELMLGCEEGLFEPLDWDTLGGRDAFIPAAVHECGVGAMLWSYLIGYDGNRIEGPGPANWADFWNVEKFPGKRGMRKTPKYTLEFALMADGVAPRDVYTVLRTPEGADRAFRKLDELKPHVIWWHSISQVPQLLASGEVSMSVTSPGRLIVANETDRTNFKLAWSGNIYAVDFWAVLKNSPRRDEAMRLVRYMTRPEQQRELAALIPTGLTNKEAIATVDPALKTHTPSDPANMVRAVALDAAFWVENLDRLTQRFNAWAAQ